MSDDGVQRLAELIVRFGANVQPGQVVAVGAEPGKEPLARAIAVAAYEAGAKFVDVTYFDLHIKRARVQYAAEDTLEYVPDWYGERLTQLADMHGARIGLTGPVAPGLLDDLDPQRVAKDQLPFLKETIGIVNARTTNWCAAPCPTPAWAELVFPDLEPAAALDKLWEQILHVCRLDEPDPVAAWGERAEKIVGVAGRLTDHRFDAVRFVGPGTDLTVGLLPTSKWIAARFETVDGLVHMPNLPSEEIFSTPDPERVSGHVTSTKPLVVAGNIIRGLKVTFENGRATQIDADEGAEVMRGIVERDPGAARLGEVALVDGEGRIGPLGTVFYDTLLDENAASHVALGSAYALCVDAEDTDKINTSAIHIDFMIGSPEVDVLGVTASGDEIPVLTGGAWQV
ncbi:MAG: aminopeptidase [Solirubrobacteraceae bacterium]|nr:aminopeptidase [Solirubrobacteraceae bacterium]